MKSIKLKNVTKSFDGEAIIRDINLALRSNQFHFIAGPNGSGKTTLFNLILGLYKPTQGNIVRSDDAKYGCSYQRPNFYRDLTVGENLSIFSEIRDREDQKWIEKVKNKLNLDKILDKKCSELSAGNAKRFDLSLSVIKKPDFLILDEPLSNLDEYSRSIFLEFLQKENSINGAILFSHHLQPFDDLIERLTIIQNGKVIKDKNSNELDLDKNRTFSDIYKNSLE